MVAVRRGARTSPQPQRKRKDPESRHFDASASWARLENRDPGRHYVFAYRNDGECGLDYYLTNGYSIEVHRKDGPKFPGNKQFKEGEEMAARGYVLVSTDNENYERIRQYGVDGNGGMSLADEMEAKIVDRNNGGIDGLRGLRFNGIKAGMFDVRNATSVLEEEYA